MIMACVNPIYRYPRGSIGTTNMELGPQNHNEDGLLGPNSIIVVYVDPLSTWNMLHVLGNPKPYRCLEHASFVRPWLSLEQLSGPAR